MDGKKDRMIPEIRESEKERQLKKKNKNKTKNATALVYDQIANMVNTNSTV